MTTKYVNSYGYVLTDTVYKNGNEYVLLENTNRLHKVYYNGSYRLDASPYIIINGLRYHLNEFIQDTF